MKLPITQLPGLVPPTFEYYQTVNLPQGGTQVVTYRGCVSSSMEGALCDLLKIAQQLAADNVTLRSMITGSKP